MAKALRNPRPRTAAFAGTQLAPLLLAVLLAFFIAVSGTAWVLQLFTRSVPVPAGALQTGHLDIETLAEAAPVLFGGQQVEAPRVAATSKRFTLVGVIGGGKAAGAALIGVAGKPPRAVAVGAQVEPGVTLLQTGFGSALLRERDAQVELRMPAAAPGPEARGSRAAATTPARARSIVPEPNEGTLPPGRVD